VLTVYANAAAKIKLWLLVQVMARRKEKKLERRKRSDFFLAFCSKDKHLFNEMWSCVL
jgi:hypothetical protein